MTNVLVLAAGDPGFNTEDGDYPLCLTELDGSPLVEKIAVSCKALDCGRFVFAMRETDATRFHLDSVVRLLVADAQIVKTGKTRGAACTALLAAPYIDNDDSLLVMNANQHVDVDLAAVIREFAERRLDAGVVTFRSVHPRYSYVSIDACGFVVEAAEKNPISQNATAGIYWFARGHDFIAALKGMIRRDANVDGAFYVCPLFNEMVLAQARVGVHPIETSRYRPLKTERQLHQLALSPDGRPYR